MTNTSRISTIRPPPAAIARRVIRVWRSVPGPLGGGRRDVVRRGRSSRSSRKDKWFRSGAGGVPARLCRQYYWCLGCNRVSQGRDRARRVEGEAAVEGSRTTNLDDRKTPRRSAVRGRQSAEDETSALSSNGDWTERLGGSYEAGPARQLVLDRYRLERRLGAGGFGVV